MKKVLFILLLVVIFNCIQYDIFGMQEKVNETVYIEFFSTINSESVNKLIITIEEKMSKGKDKFFIIIESSGGNTYAGFRIYNYLKGIDAEIITYNIGSVNSMAFIMFCAGDKRYCSPYSRFTYHKTGYNLSDFRLDLGNIGVYYQQLEIEKKYIVDVLFSIIGKKRAKEIIEEDYINGSTYTSEQALEYNLVHEIKEKIFPKDAEIIRILE